METAYRSLRPGIREGLLLRFVPPFRRQTIRHLVPLYTHMCRYVLQVDGSVEVQCEVKEQGPDAVQHIFSHPGWARLQGPQRALRIRANDCHLASVQHPPEPCQGLPQRH
eukprot:TRINITY_DN1472_c2_g2_i6.p1 TRINITY_DN1472_c2_g2~~TRINITY_DN1472_c2_g2_i6.p1  ORF type:complete len:110 (-),score=2.73 TRINITY_DN1472_c2_g2_i6:297-626(-)